MIEIIPTKKLQRVLPLGLLNTKDPLLICERDRRGRIAITEFVEYCNELGPRAHHVNQTTSEDNRPQHIGGEGE